MHGKTLGWQVEAQGLIFTLLLYDLGQVTYPFWSSGPCLQSEGVGIIGP